jgi:outer membrane protein OmpA-like peptidoglycan-associated protein
VWKTVGCLLLGAGLVVGSICVFYKPHATTVAKVDAGDGKIKPGKGGKGGGKGGAGGGMEDGGKEGGDEAKDGDKSDDSADGADGKKKDGTTIAVDGKDGEKGHMAPTVQAVIANVKERVLTDKSVEKAASGVSKLINEAQDVADSLKQKAAEGSGANGSGPGGAGVPGQPAINPTSKTKEEAVKTKDAAITVATAIIEKHDKDGTKTAELLGRIGQVSTTFADVATKMTEGVTPTGKPAGSAGSSTTGSQKLEGDVLAAQGRSGYDPEQAVERELAEEAGAQAKKTIQMQEQAKSGGVPPNGLPGVTGAPGIRAMAGVMGGGPPIAQSGVGDGQTVGDPASSGTLAPGANGAGGTVGTILQDSTVLAIASLPAAFANAARRNPVQLGPDGLPIVGAAATGGTGSGDPASAGRLSVVVLSMKGDLLFDFNSAALRPEASGQLQELAAELARRPDLPVLVRGYTDSKGTNEANLALSKKRAEAVRDWLIAKAGVKAQSLTVEGLGPSDPVAPNQNPDGSDNPSGREKNRRVTVTVPQVRQQVVVQQQAKL